MKAVILAGGVGTRITEDTPRFTGKGKTLEVRVQITNITDASEER